MTTATFTQRLQIDPTPFVRREGGGRSSIDLAVKGMRCAGCIAKIERTVGAMPGVEEARVNLSTAKLAVQWQGPRTNAAKIVARVNALGFEAFPYDPQAVISQNDEEGRSLLRCLAVAGFAASNVMFLSICVWAGFDGEMGEGTRALFHWISGLVAVPAALYSGRPFFRSAARSLARGQANMDVPISLGILLALGLSLSEALQGGRYTYFDAAVSLPFLLLIGRYLDHLLRSKARSAALELAAMQSVTTNRVGSDGVTAVVAANEIVPGDRLLLAAGDRVPVDGVVESGTGSLDVSLVTGESAPVVAAPGDAVRSGSLLLGQPLTVRATARVHESLVADLARLLEAGQQNRGRYVRLADRAAALYVPLVHGAALAVFLGGWIAGIGVHGALTNAVALLIITCPCALGLAVPAVQIVATSRLFRSGVLVKSGDALERLAEADNAIFDKTGTLTLGRPVLINAGAVGAGDLAIAAGLARASRHPLARALAEAAGPGAAVAGVREAVGQGLDAVIDGVSIRLGRASWVGAVEAPADGAPEIWLKKGEATPVRFVFADRLRADAKRTVAALERRGLSVEMLSGDREAPAAAMARDAGISVWRALTDPKQKIERVSDLHAEGHHTVMVGDGLNDAAALAHAHVSISPATAADASQAAADIVLQGDALMPIVEAIDVARAARRLVLQNFGFAVLYNALAVPLAASGLVTPLIAAVAMSGSSLLVMLNAFRLAGRS